jgi:hypothetical protein
MALSGWKCGDESHHTDGEYRTDYKGPSFHDVRTWSNVESSGTAAERGVEWNDDKQIS